MFVYNLGTSRPGPESKKSEQAILIFKSQICKMYFLK